MPKSDRTKGSGRSRTAVGEASRQDKKQRHASIVDRRRNAAAARVEEVKRLNAEVFQNSSAWKSAGASGASAPRKRF